MSLFTIHPITPHDRAWIRSIVSEHWGAVEVVSRGRIYSADQLPGFIARQAGSAVGLITYRIEADQCEIITINSLVHGRGIGSALIDAVHQEAMASGCTRLWLITTNDNLPALRFYQKRGFKLAAIHREAINVSRKLKPQIPLIGIDGIPIRDELELEMPLP
jgi:ribosomal protein S18 acetylase RimI-like enzyme